MELKGNKKILILGLILLVLAGIIVIALKGINVDLMFAKHESVDIVIGKEFNMTDIENICKEVFNGKKVVLKSIEEFDDSVNINVVSITDEEKSNLISKINEKYGTELKEDEITVNSNANIRIRDIARPYIMPMIISYIIIYIYIAIRFRKLNILKVLGALTLLLVVTEVVIISVISITRLPFTAPIMSLMIAIAIIETILYTGKKEKEMLTDVNQEK